jgi:GNAT superfamily N-acetyltransferase
MLEKQSYVFKETLKDGTEVTLRAARPDDGPRIRRALAKLHPETIYRRFFGYRSDFSAAELERITGMDFQRDVALLVTIDSGGDEIIIGGASYSTADLPSRTAELAFTVEEDYQGLGIATLLLRHIIQIARAKGLARLEADVLAQNGSMLTVFRQSGLPMVRQGAGDVVHVTLSLGDLSHGDLN